ncbi:uncharacterized protein LOC122502404 [Leptopilina heterotoma]|uniref:uncharacterized protein LOC122502404 n=1 Tax=Leptopilina heterotoma TaxID=63436 RepID=UPI001CA9F4FE|nr:uncharacterized protein LOC122502404 [Leptopilina heterotoma]
MSNVEPIFKDTIQDTVETLLLIQKLFGPIHVGKWKTSAVNILSGFLLHVNDTNGIEVAVQRLKDKLNSVKRTLQPFPIVVGPDFQSITDSYVMYALKHITPSMRITHIRVRIRGFFCKKLFMA